MLKRRVSLALLAAGAVLVLPAIALAAANDPCAAKDDWQAYQAQGLLWMYLGAFGFGFLTSLTPCVYPMIPIVVGVFGARDEAVTRTKAFALATAYVFGMGVMYAVLGVIFALLGKQFGTILANPWVVIPLVLFYVALAASMFGAFELNLPSSLQNRLNQIGGRGYGGAFGMGLVGGLTAAPCTGPFLAGILGFVASTRDIAAGSTLLFTYALGMGVLFWIIAAFTVSLPKSGRWMEWVKSFGGIALLAVGIYFLRPIVPALDSLGDSSIGFLAGSILLLVIGIALGAIHLSFHDAWPVRIRKGLGVALAVLGITGVVSWVVTPDRHLPWQYEEEAAFALAKREGKGVMIDFAADWCAPCKELELTFAKDPVFETLKDRFVPLKYDVSKGTEEDEARQEKWNAETLPAVIFINADGKEIGRVSKYLPPEEFMKMIPMALNGQEPCLTTSQAPAAGSGDSERPAGHSELTWLTDEAAAFAQAKSTGKGVFIDFYSTWCEPCMKMESTFASPEIATRLKAGYVPLRFDLTNDTDEDERRKAKYRVSILPTMLFVDAKGRELRRVTEYVEPSAFLAAIDHATN